MNQRPLLIGFSASKSLVSRLIRRVTGAPVSHAFVVYWSLDYACYMVMEMVGRGLSERPWHEYLADKSTAVHSVFRPVVDVSAAFPATKTWLADAYNYEGLFGMLAVLFGQLLRRKLKNPLHSPKSMFCSEMCARLLIAAKYPGSVLLNPPDDVTPGFLYQLLRTDGSCQILARRP